MHAGGLFGPEIVAEGFFARARNKITSLFRSSAGFVEQLRESREMREDLGMFFLKSEYYDGGINEQGLEAAGKKLEEIIEDFRQMAENDKNIYRVLHELIQEQGAYKGNSSYLSRLLLGRKGNCEARAKLIISITNKVYPDLPVKLQLYRDHIRALVQISGQWYSMEKPTLEPVTEEDLKNTVLADSSFFVQSYLGEEASVEEVEVTGNPNPPKTLVTDTPFTNLIDSDVNKKLADYSGEIPLDETEEVRHEFEEVSAIPPGAELPEPIESVPPKESNIQITYLTEEQTEELLHNRNWFPGGWYEQLNDREKGLVDLYRDKKYEILIKRTNFIPLKGAIDREVKKFSETDLGFLEAEWSHRILEQLNKTAKRIMATEDMGHRQLILCEFRQRVERIESYYNKKIIEEGYDLNQDGLEISSLDETLDFFVFWRALQELCGFPKSELGPDEEECNRIFKNNNRIDLISPLNPSDHSL